MEYLIKEFVGILQTGGGWAVACVLAYWIIRKDKEVRQDKAEFQKTYVALLTQSVQLFQTLADRLEQVKQVIEKCPGPPEGQ